jgi:Beta-galactosidase trimerisation domain
VHNWAWLTRNPVNPPPHVTHVNWDTATPNMSVYALDLSLEARYLSTLGNRSWALHNTRGNSWGDYSLREEAAFMQEVATELAAGGRSLLSDDAYPSGNPDPAVYEIYGRVNERTRKLEPFLEGCRPVKDVAVLHSADTIWSKTLSPEWKAGPAYYPVSGAHKVLIEGQVQMNILNTGVLVDTLGEYRALVLADQRILSDRECDAIRRFVREGGSLLATCGTGTRDRNNRASADFTLADVFGVRRLGPSTATRSFLRVPSKIALFGVPRMDVQVNGSYVRVEATTAKTLLELVPPDGPKQSPASASEGPGATLNQYGKGQVLYCAAPVFSAYYAEGPAMLRRLALWMLNVVHPGKARSIFLEDTPPNVEVFYNQRGQDRFVHLVNYSGDKRETGPAQSQAGARVHGIHVRARVPAAPKRVVAVPENRAIPFESGDTWVSFTANPLEIHSVYLIEC